MFIQSSLLGLLLLASFCTLTLSAGPTCKANPSGLGRGLYGPQVYPVRLRRLRQFSGIGQGQCLAKCFGDNAEFKYCAYTDGNCDVFGTIDHGRGDVESRVCTRSCFKGTSDCFPFEEVHLRQVKYYKSISVMLCRNYCASDPTNCKAYYTQYKYRNGQCYHFQALGGTTVCSCSKV